MFSHGKMPRKEVFTPYPTGVEGRSPKFQEPLDLRSNLFQGGGDDAILTPKGIG